jgi:DNA-binding MarR family transcriptional regulator
MAISDPIRSGMTIDAAFFAKRKLKVPDDSLGFVLWRATHAWQRFLEQALIPTGLTHLRFALLVALAWLTHKGDSVTQRQLADFLGMQPMQVSQVVTMLEKAGLMVRRPSPRDQRAFALALTAAGEASLRAAMPIVEGAHRSFFAKPGIEPETIRKALLTLV